MVAGRLIGVRLSLAPRGGVAWRWGRGADRDWILLRPDPELQHELTSRPKLWPDNVEKRRLGGLTL
jgi:hypothetical protein